jgi:hypothetical protein
VCHSPDRRTLDHKRGPAAIPLTTSYKANGSTALGHAREAHCRAYLRLRGQLPMASQGETGGLTSASYFPGRGLDASRRPWPLSRAPLALRAPYSE